MPAPTCIKINSTKARVLVALGNQESGVRMIPTPSSDAQASIACESFTVALLATDPSTRPRAMGPGPPGCGLAHPVRVASLAKGSEGWSLAPAKWHTFPSGQKSKVNSRIMCELPFHLSGRFDVAVRAEDVLRIPCCLNLGKTLDAFAQRGTDALRAFVCG